ncbi:hypothetical protein [Deinococcus altitudinis]|uniref:hypothetical protein n=1 Tax=Deinococcus altitudinis TaxID=468914 RepID=UPI003892839D
MNRRFIKNLLAALALLASSGTSFAGGAGPASHVVDATFSAPSVTVHPGDTLRVHMVEEPLQGGQRWTSVTQVPGLRLLRRDDEPQGDHGYLSTISDITYTYKVVSPSPGLHTMLFSLVNPDEPQYTILWPLLVKVVQ